MTDQEKQRAELDYRMTDHVLKLAIRYKMAEGLGYGDKEVDELTEARNGNYRKYRRLFSQ